MELTVRKAEDRSRYELVEGEAVVGVAEYDVQGDTIVFPHTAIDPTRRGRGFGAVLVRAVLDDVRPTGQTVVPTCWFVREFIEVHPEYADLLA